MYGLSPEESSDLILSVGIHRTSRPLSPMQVAQLLLRAKQAGASTAQLAAALHLDGPTMIGRFLKLNALDPVARATVDWGASHTTVGFTSAAEIARLPAADQTAAARATLAHAMTTAEMKELVQLRARSGRPMDECITEIVSMRPRLEQVNVFLGQITAADVRQRLSDLGQSIRDDVLRRALLRRIPAIRGAVECRLGDASFILAGNDETASSIRAAFSDLEEEITGLVAEELA